MWECPNFYLVALSGKARLDILVMFGGKNGLVKRVVKINLDTQKHNYYTLGTHNKNNNAFTADDPSLDVGVGLRYDYGKFYASMAFFNHKMNQRIL